MSDLIFMIGIPGSGKTTWSKQFVKDNSNYIRICPDEIREELTGNISDQSKNNLVWEITKKRVIENLKSKNVILDATNLKNKDRNKFIKGIEANIKYKIFEIDKETAKERIKKDLENKINRSKVPPEKIDLMYETFIQNIENLDKSKII